MSDDIIFLVLLFIGMIIAYLIIRKEIKDAREFRDLYDAIKINHDNRPGA